MILRGIYLFLSILLLFSCNQYSQPTIVTSSTTNYKPALSIVLPINNAQYSIGESIKIDFRVVDSTKTPDSIVFLVNKSRQGTIPFKDSTIYWIDQQIKTGTTLYSLLSYYSGNSYASSVTVKLLSDIEPKKYTYKIIKTFKHDITSYTQGLIFENNFFYESGGLYNESSLRKVKLDGTVEIKNPVEGRYFAEGLTALNGKLYQLTWREQIAFVYSKSDFSLVKTSNYSIAEGWGLTNNGTNLIMSDGSNKIYTLEPEYFSEISHIEVFDNRGAVNNINELELVGDILYANIYQTNTIATIDVNTGKILGYIDCSGLLNESDYRYDTDVLNGIAYNPENKHFYITGKKWPKLFEVVFIEK